ncbi:MAG: mannose-1-phosphate guanylyltransferase [Pirellulaceae bacterium]
MANLYAIIMAGGSGTRFWPASRKQLPKQLLNLVGQRTMLQSTVDRLTSLCGPEQTMVVSNEILTEQIRKQLPELPTDSIVGEPAKRDTAPCVGLAAAMVMAKDPEATMVVMPADHVIQPVDQFQGAIQKAVQLVDDDPKRIVTFGIRPNYPAEVFGYIERDAASQVLSDPATYRVKQFREKPDAKTAQQFLDDGNFYWNAGIFVWKARTIAEALWEYEPDIASHIDVIARSIGTSDFANVFRKEFSAIQGKSIDFAVMERYPNVLVMEAPFEWNDVGNWTSLERLNPQNDQGNTVLGKHLAIETSNSIVVAEPGHLVATIGVEDLVIVQTRDATLVARKSDEAAVKMIVEQIEAQNLDSFL